MTCKKIIVMPAKQLKANIFWFIEKIPIIKESTEVFHILLWFFKGDLLGFVIRFLKFLEPQPYNSSISPIKVFFG